MEMTVAHYSPTLPVLVGNSKTFGKFIIETFQFEEDKPKQPCNILDFVKGVYIVSSSSDRRSRHEAVFRLLSRQNENKTNHPI